MFVTREVSFVANRSKRPVIGDGVDQLSTSSSKFLARNPSFVSWLRVEFEVSRAMRSFHCAKVEETAIHNAFPTISFSRVSLHSYLLPSFISRRCIEGPSVFFFRDSFFAKGRNGSIPREENIGSTFDRIKYGWEERGWKIHATIVD